MRRRSGFTLVELLVVITILLVLATLVFAVFRTGAGSDRMRSAARIVQSAFLGAKDRALHAKDLRGVRFTRDLNNPLLVTGFMYLQPLPLQTAQGITVSSPSGTTNPILVTIPAAQGTSWYAQDQAGIWPYQSVQVRIPSQTGAWYQLLRQSGSPPYWGQLNQNNDLVLTLAAPFQGGSPPPAPYAVSPTTTPTLASCDVVLGQELLPFHQPIQLTAATVVDLTACSSNVQSLAGIGAGATVQPNIDIMFSARGMIAGPLVAQGPMHMMLRDIQDASLPFVYLIPSGQTTPVPFSSALIVGPVPKAVTSSGSSAPLPKDPNIGDRLIVSLFPQTGLVQTFEIDPTDNFDLTTNQPGSDGIADNVFNFAQQGRSAGR